jgi:hypothetical protein
MIRSRQLVERLIKTVFENFEPSELVLLNKWILRSKSLDDFMDNHLNPDQLYRMRHGRDAIPAAGTVDSISRAAERHARKNGLK